MVGVLATSSIGGCRAFNRRQDVIKLMKAFRCFGSNLLAPSQRESCSFRNARRYKSGNEYSSAQSWQEIDSFNRHGTSKNKKYVNRSSGWEETVQEINDGYRKFQDEEMALLTDNPKSLPMLEAILKSPLKLQDWSILTKKERFELEKVAAVFDARKQPSVSKILQETGSPMNIIILNKWKRKKIEEMGEEGFKEYMHMLTTDGTTFHKAIEHFFEQVPVEISELGQWKSILPFLEKVSMVECLENNVSHPFLTYHGRVDCVGTYNGTLCLFDWKLSTKRKDTIKKCYDDPYQVAAYAGAFNMCNDESKQVSNAVIVKAYRDGTPADIHFLNNFVLEFYWEGWLRRLARHHMQIVNSISSEKVEKHMSETSGP